MKHILIAIIGIVAAYNSMAQDVDSTKIYVKNIVFQARDIELMTPWMLTGIELYEDFYDLAKAKFRVGNPPSNLQNVTIDSLRVDVLIDISTRMRTSDYGTVANFFSRVDGVIKGLTAAANGPGVPYLLRRVSEIDQGYLQRIIEVRTEGRRRLRGIRL